MDDAAAQLRVESAERAAETAELKALAKTAENAAGAAAAAQKTRSDQQLADALEQSSFAAALLANTAFTRFRSVRSQVAEV